MDLSFSDLNYNSVVIDSVAMLSSIETLPGFEAREAFLCHSKALRDNPVNSATITPILITDFTSELSDTDEKLNSVKFTWRFAENRPKIAVSQSPGIFNDKFNPTFS